MQYDGIWLIKKLLYLNIYVYINPSIIHTYLQFTYEVFKEITQNLIER